MLYYIFIRIVENVLKLLVFVFVGTVIGGFGGSIIAGIAFFISGEYFSFGVSFGLPVGMVLGFSACLLAYVFVNKSNPREVARILLVATFFPSFILALIPELGAPLAAFGAIAGFIGGTVVIFMRRITGVLHKGNSGTDYEISHDEGQLFDK